MQELKWAISCHHKAETEQKKNHLQPKQVSDSQNVFTQENWLQYGFFMLLFFQNWLKHCVFSGGLQQ